MAFEQLKAAFPGEGSRCLKNCGKCCIGGTPVSQPEMQELMVWICKNKTFEQFRDQLQHYDEHGFEGDMCPFLTPEKTCFVYPARPVACHAFGHIPDLSKNQFADEVVKTMSQKCPEKVEFTEVTVADIGHLIPEWLEVSARAFARIRVARHAAVSAERGKEEVIPRKDGSKPPIIVKEHGL